MNIEDEVRVVKSETVPAGSPIPPYTSLQTREVYDLIRTLSSKGVNIESNKSEKVVDYSQNNESKKATVPLDTMVGSNFNPFVDEYDLRGDSMEIVLRNYRHSHSHSAPGARGGDVSHTTGVVAELTYSGEDFGKGTGLVKTAKEVIRDFYTPSQEEMRKRFGISKKIGVTRITKKPKPQ